MKVTVTLPTNQFLQDTPNEVAEKIKLYAAVGMYQAGKLSIGAACELADVDLYWFLDFLKRQKIPIQTQSPDELEADFQKITSDL